MCLHCNLADAEFTANLFIQQARDNQRHNLLFPGSKRGITVAEFLHFRILSEGKTASFEGVADGAQQHVVIQMA